MVRCTVKATRALTVWRKEDGSQSGWLCWVWEKEEGWLQGFSPGPCAVGWPHRSSSVNISSGSECVKGSLLWKFSSSVIISIRLHSPAGNRDQKEEWFAQGWQGEKSGARSLEMQAPADLLLHSPMDEVPILKVILSSEVVARALNITYMVQGKNKRKRRNGHKRHILPVSFLPNSCHESRTEEGWKMCN